MTGLLNLPLKGRPSQLPAATAPDVALQISMAVDLDAGLVVLDAVGVLVASGALEVTPLFTLSRTMACCGGSQRTMVSTGTSPSPSCQRELRLRT